MQIIKTTAGFAIKLPYALKDTFRAAFPSAKWNATEKQWEVGSRSGKRLEQFIAEAGSTAEALQVNEETLMSDSELQNIRLSLNSVKSQLKAIEEIRAEAKAAADLLAAAKAELASTTAEVAAANAALVEEKAQVEALLAGVVDMPAIRKAAAIMSANMVPADRNKKAAFEAAREEVKVQRDRLAAAGFRCSAIGQLAGANVNRPDRDHPKFIAAADWLAVRKIEAE